MKRVLIISPYFPPDNTPDVHRVRMSLPFFEQLGWQAEVVAVNPEYTDLAKDDNLMQTIPLTIPVHHIPAFSRKHTRRIGFGSIGYRALLSYRKYVDRLLNTKKFDLVYFSTTQFPVCILGPYWKQRFSIPFVIDIQDMWHSDYYKDKASAGRPANYWLAYRMNKWMERWTMKTVSGVITVSDVYANILKARYPALVNLPVETITFGAAAEDFSVLPMIPFHPPFEKPEGVKSIVYAGRGGADMARALGRVFSCFSRLLQNDPAIQVLRFYFVGTSYAPAGTGVETLRPVAAKWGVENYVEEHVGRIGYFDTLHCLKTADALFIPGSDDPAYTASKIYPYVLTARPLLAVFSETSSAYHILSTCTGATVVALDDDSEPEPGRMEAWLRAVAEGREGSCKVNEEQFSVYSARETTRKQVEVFNRVIHNNE
jgi:hypothetical protein